MTIEHGEFSFDAGLRRLKKGARTHSLSPRQARILFALMSECGRVLTREELAQRAELRTESGTGVSRSLDMHVMQLRRLIEECPNQPRHILTVRAIGYRFVAT